MRRSRVQFTLGSLMLAIAIFGCFVAASKFKRRSAEYSQMAQEWKTRKELLQFMIIHTQRAIFRIQKIEVGNAKSRAERAISDRERLFYIGEARNWEAMIDRHSGRLEKYQKDLVFAGGMQAKYERAARSPWLTLEDDPVAKE